jgi:hypothetical protein
LLRKITIPVDPPIVGHSGMIREIVLQEPSVLAVLKLGDPYSIGMSPSGVQLIAENPEAIEAYVEQCIIEPRGGTLFLAQGGVGLARAIKTAVLSFFLDGGAADEASPTSSTISPSAPESA